jgi:hypothetical protein
VPNAAIVDFELTMSMPARLTADTGTDSLTHAIEAYVSRKANAFADAFALAAMKTIWAELPTAFRDPGNRRARESMMLAATQAGMAFSNASVALVHGMSRPENRQQFRDDQIAKPPLHLGLLQCRASIVSLRNSVKFPFCGSEFTPLHSVHDSGRAQGESLSLQSKERFWLGH